MIRDNREYRSAMENAQISEENEYIIEGYALVWDKPYELYKDERGNSIYEVIKKSSFDNTTDLSDVILLKDHEGTVYARNKNNTLQLINDDHGLKIRADLSSTNGTKELYDEIRAELYTKMSWAFKCDADNYDVRSHTRTVEHISKVYDVSVVSRPANDDTTVFTRSLVDGFIEQEKLELARRESIEKQKQRIKILALCNQNKMR